MGCGASASSVAPSPVSPAAPLCSRAGCGKPTWNGQPNEFCSKSCRNLRVVHPSPSWSAPDVGQGPPAQGHIAGQWENVKGRQGDFSLHWNLSKPDSGIEISNCGSKVAASILAVRKHSAGFAVDFTFLDVDATIDVVTLERSRCVMHGRFASPRDHGTYFGASRDAQAVSLVQSVLSELQAASRGRLQGLQASDSKHADQLMSNGGCVLILDSQKHAPGEAERLCRKYAGRAVVFSRTAAGDQQLQGDAHSWGARCVATSAAEAACAAAAIAGCAPPRRAAAGPLVVGVSGPTRSGKSTLVKTLQDEFGKRGISAVSLGGNKGLDTYFNKPWIKDPAHGANNWETPGALNHQEILRDCIKEEEALASKGSSVLLVEGFRAFWDPRLACRMHARIEVDVDKQTALRRRVATKGGEAVRPYFESTIWPEHCRYRQAAVVQLPLVSTFDQPALSSPDAAVRSVFACKQLDVLMRGCQLSTGKLSTGGPAVCGMPGCGKPTWNNKAGTFCSHSCRSGSRSQRTIPNAPRIEQLLPGDPTFENVENQFKHSWDTSRCPVPPVKTIYETLPCSAILSRYTAKASEIERTNPGKNRHDCGDGNENRRWHGTRLMCSFPGSVCNGASCAVCGIIRAGEFRLSKLGAATGNLGVYGPGIYFTSKASTAKGYGLAPGNTPPPASVTDFVSPSAGNALFLCKVLVGKTEVVTSPDHTVPSSSYHSRTAQKPTGVDELVLFHEEQAIPQYLVII